jgi:hypothetical protein
MSDMSQPLAWAVLRIDGSVYDVYRNEEEAKAIDEAVTGNHGVVSLCRSPTLADDEREALGKVLRRVREDYFAGRFADSVKVAAVIDGLLERTK